MLKGNRLKSDKYLGRTPVVHTEMLSSVDKNLRIEII